MLVPAGQPESKYISLTQKFIKNGGDVNELYDLKVYVKNHYGAIKALPLQINGVDFIKRQTLLHFAAFNGKIELVKLLLAHGANPLLLNSQNESAIDDALRGLADKVCRGEAIDLQLQILLVLIEALSDENRKFLKEQYPHVDVFIEELREGLKKCTIVVEN